MAANALGILAEEGGVFDWSPDPAGASGVGILWAWS
jgi:hypothetical protein